MQEIKVIGAGLAGVEASYYLANKGYKVKLYEMRPKKMTPAHKTEKFGELVCSNSLRADSLENAVGILKREMEMFDSLIMKCAREHKVEAGGALAVDREGFSEAITEIIKSHPNIEIVYDEIQEFDLETPTIVCTGPLTSDGLSNFLIKTFDSKNFHFYDAAAPIVLSDSLDYNKVYLKSRYDKGEASYLNCPMTKEEFEAFYNELINAEGVVPHSFENIPTNEEDIKVFEGCMPVELIAKRGPQTLLFGPLKPVGLEKPNGERPYAVVQLRQDDAAKTMYNLVGFQTHLKWGEQKRVFSMIPGLENATFVKYGVMHRNSFINAPLILNQAYQTKKHPNIFIAGQLSGVEGYVESAASGIVAAINMHRFVKGQELHFFSRKTVMGSMAYYITHANPNGFEPMNANFGIIEDIPFKHKKKERKKIYAEIALKQMAEEKELI